jgi:CubicO group peptidase (beta-lactamase class C family)
MAESARLDMTRPVAMLALLLSAAAAAAAPDEGDLGKADGYPAQRFGPEFSLLAERYKVGTFSSMEQVFWSREVAAGPTPYPLSRSEATFSVQYPYNGQTLSLDDFLERQRVTGLLILKGDQIVVERYQYDRQPEHRFASMSMAKTVTALLIGIALKEERISSLDDPAEKYAPDLKGTAYGPVPIRHLLRMSSGAKWSDRVVAGQATDIAQLTADTFYRRGRGGASALARVKDSVAPPGTVFNYASAETFALGLVLRGAIHGDIATYMAERLWKPLGAESAASWLTDWSGTEVAFCCINARLRDYGRLGLLMANDGTWNGQEIVPRQFMLEATDATRQPDYLKPRRASQFFGYGYQTWLYPYRTRTFQARGLFGQEIIVQPDSKIVVVITSVNRTPDTANDVFVERNYFVGAVLKALGGNADVYR